MKKIVREELTRLATSAGGILKPEAVVAAAKSPKSPLHDLFTWDDSEAAHAYRLWEARHLIARVKVTIEIAPEQQVKVRAFHQLESEEGGYRPVVVILNDPAMKRQLFKQLTDDLDRIQEKYATLKTMAASKKVLAAIAEFLKAERPQRAE